MKCSNSVQLIAVQSGSTASHSDSLTACDGVAAFVSVLCPYECVHFSNEKPSAYIFVCRYAYFRGSFYGIFYNALQLHLGEFMERWAPMGYLWPRGQLFQFSLYCSFDSVTQYTCPHTRIHASDLIGVWFSSHRAFASPGDAGMRARSITYASLCFPLFFSFSVFFVLFLDSPFSSTEAEVERERERITH